MRIAVMLRTGSMSERPVTSFMSTEHEEAYGEVNVVTRLDPSPLPSDVPVSCPEDNQIMHGGRTEQELRLTAVSVKVRWSTLKLNKSLTKRGL